MAASGWMTTSNQYIQYWIELIQNSQDTANNKSNVTVKVWIQRMNSGYETYGTGTVYVNIDGGAYSAGITTSQKITSTPIVIFQKTLDISHTPDGSKWVEMAASISHSTFSSNTQYWGTWLTTIPRASQPSGSDPDGWYWFGETITIYTNRASGSFTHTLRYSWSGVTGTIANNVATSQAWVIPKSLMDKIPNDTYSQGTIYCDTYSGGTFIGTKSFTIYGAVIDANPTFTTITHSENVANVQTKIGAYVQSLSRLNLAITGAQGNYSSTIKKYEITVEGVTYGNNSVSNVLQSSGTVRITGKITDSRGNTATKTVDITVLAYAPPSITSLSIARFKDSAGLTPDAMGTYAKVTRAGNWSSLNSKNTLSVVIKSRARGASSWTTKNTFNAGASGAVSGSTTVGTYSATSSHDFQIEFTDQFNTTLTLTVLATGQVTMSWGKAGIAIGKVWEQGALDVEGDVFVSGEITAAKGVGPAGSIQMFAGSAAPTGYLLCQGQAVSRTTYKRLFDVIGTTYGTGDGSTTFNLPDLRGRVPVGYNSAEAEFNALNKKGGAKTHTLTESEIARHWHSIKWMDSVNSATAAYYTTANLKEGYGTGTQRTLWANGIYADYAGGDQPHNNLQPYITLNFIIRY